MKISHQTSLTEKSDLFREIRVWRQKLHVEKKKSEIETSKLHVEKSKLHVEKPNLLIESAAPLRTTNQLRRVPGVSGAIRLAASLSCLAYCGNLLQSSRSDYKILQ